MYTPSPLQNNSDDPNLLNALGGKLLGYVSIALGILSIIISLLPCINLIAIVIAIVGLVAGIFALRQSAKAKTSNKYALGGIVLAVLGIIISLVINNFVLDKIGDYNDGKKPSIENKSADY